MHFSKRSEHDFQNSKIKNIEDLPLVLTVADVSRLLGVGQNKAYDLIRCGAIRSVRAGRQIRIPKSSFLEFFGQKD